MKFFWPPTEWGEVRAPENLLQLSNGVDPHTSWNLLNYYITLADLSFERFACYAIQRNDLNDLRKRLQFTTIGRNTGSKQDDY